MYFVRVACFLCCPLSFDHCIACSFFDLRLLITPLVISIFSYMYILYLYIICHLVLSPHCYHPILITTSVSVLAVDRWVESRSGQTKDYEIRICCFSAKHAALRSKSKDWSVRNQNNVS